MVIEPRRDWLRAFFLMALHLSQRGEVALRSMERAGNQINRMVPAQLSRLRRDNKRSLQTHSKAVHTLIKLPIKSSFNALTENTLIITP